MHHIENGLIERTTLGFEVHGILSFNLLITSAGGGQGFGGYALDGKPDERSAQSERTPHPVCGAMIAGLLRTLRVEAWEDLRGTHVRVRRDHPFGRILAIGHIIEDRWFDPGAVAQAVEKAGRA